MTSHRHCLRTRDILCWRSLINPRGLIVFIWLLLYVLVMWEVEEVEGRNFQLCHIWKMRFWNPSMRHLESKLKRWKKIAMTETIWNCYNKSLIILYWPNSFYLYCFPLHVPGGIWLIVSKLFQINRYDAHHLEPEFLIQRLPSPWWVHVAFCMIRIDWLKKFPNQHRPHSFTLPVWMDRKTLQF